MTGRRPVSSGDLRDGCPAGESSPISAKLVDVIGRILFVILAVLIVCDRLRLRGFARDLASARELLVGRSKTVKTGWDCACLVI